MRILSWNVNGVRACVRKGFLDFVKARRPDVVCLQETKAVRDQCPDVHKDALGMEEFWHSAERPGYSGVLFLAQQKPKSMRQGMGENSIDREGRVLLMDQGSFYVINSYFPNGAANEDRHWFKMRYLEKFLEFLKDLDKKKPVVLCGDLNIAHRKLDIHDPVRLDGVSGFKPEERAWMDQLVEAGFVDVFRHFYPEAEEEYSWWSYRAASRQRNKGWRIDYFVVSKRLKSKLKSMTMHQTVPGSDHCPLELEVAS